MWFQDATPGRGDLGVVLRGLRKPSHGNRTRICNMGERGGEVWSPARVLCGQGKWR